MQNLQSQVVVDGLRFPEGIRWHADKVWFSDILDHKVLCWDPSSGTKRLIASLRKPSGLGFLPDGKLIVVLMEEQIGRAHV